MESKQYPDLQIGENMRQQRIEWTIERIAWFFLYLLLIGIALGLLGQGPLSSTRLASPDGTVQLQYNRFTRNKAPDQLKVTLPASPGPLRLTLSSSFMQKVELKNITPTPEKAIAQGSAIVFLLHANSTEPIDVQIHYEPQQAGRLAGWISVADGPRVEFQQFVYP